MEKEKKYLIGVVGVLLSLTFLSFMIPISSPTGYVSKTFDFSKSIGEYELNLDFMVKKEFEFTMFEKIDAEIKRISDSCLNSTDRNSCINGALAQSNPLKMKLGPQNVSKAELTRFAEQFHWCKESMDTNCYCNITFNQSTDELKRVYEGLVISNSRDTLYFSSVNYDFEIEIPYNESYKNFLRDITDDGKKTFENRNNLYFKKDSSNILEKVADVQGMQKCSINQEMFVFSIPSPLTRKHMFYDRKNDEYVFEKPDIEFAILLKDITPPKKTDFNMQPMPFSDKKILIEFKASEEKDTVDYILFYSNRTFKDDNILEVLQGKITDVGYVKMIGRGLINGYYDYLSLIPDCIDELKDPNKRYCDMNSILYDTDGNEVRLKLDDTKTYNLSGISKFASLISLPDEKTYYATIVPMDASGNIIEFKEANIVTIDNKDLLHPSIFFEADPKIIKNQNSIQFDFTNIKMKNIDGSDVSDAKEYWLYHKKDPRDPNRMILSSQDSLPQKISSSMQNQQSSHNGADPYCYFIIATDIEMPNNLQLYNTLLSQDEYYGNLQVEYTCITN